MAGPVRPIRWVRHVGFPDHPVCINAEDFDPEIHAEIGGAAEPAAEKPPAKPSKRAKE